MKKFLVTFKDNIMAETEDDAYDKLLDYMRYTVRYEDVTPFDFKEIKEPKGSYHM